MMAELPILPLKQGDPAWKHKERLTCDELFMVRLTPRLEPAFRFGIVVKKKIGKAVTRTLIKRRLRHALRACMSAFFQPLAQPLACLVIVKTAQVASCDFEEICHRLRQLMGLYAP